VVKKGGGGLGGWGSKRGGGGGGGGLVWMGQVNYGLIVYNKTLKTGEKNVSEKKRRI